MPKQQDDAVEDKIESGAKVGKSAAATGFVVLVGTFLLSYFKKSVMNRMLSQVRNLGLITHLMMMQLQYPAGQAGFFQGVFPLVTFDAMPDFIIDPLNEKLFPAENDEAYSE